MIFCYLQQLPELHLPVQQQQQEPLLAPDPDDAPQPQPQEVINTPSSQPTGSIFPVNIAPQVLLEPVNKYDHHHALAKQPIIAAS